jgi:hypothetical protein
VSQLESTVFAPCGLATGIGSLPFIETPEALAMIRTYLPAIPHWPQLPRRGSSENFVFQFLQPLVDMKLLDVAEAGPYFNTAHSSWPDRLTEFYSLYFAAAEGDPEALRRYAPTMDSAPGLYAFLDDITRTGLDGINYLKGQMSGPLTAGFQLKDERGRLAYYQDQLRDLIVRTLAMHARWQATTLSCLGRPAIILVDDSCISACGSGYHVALPREMIIEDLNTIRTAVIEENARLGVHSCNIADWSLLFESDVEIVSLDAYRFGASLVCYAAQMEEFLQRGGVMAWGIVPTLEGLAEEDAGSLMGRLLSLWQELIQCGVDGKRLLTQSMITPACGMGLLSPELADKLYKLTAEVSAMTGAMIQVSAA